MIRKEKQLCRFKIMRLYPKEMGRAAIQIGQYNKIDNCIEAALMQISRERQYKEVLKGELLLPTYGDFRVFEYNLNDIDGYSQEPMLLNYCSLSEIIDLCTSGVIATLTHKNYKRHLNYINLT